jgi:hypothetical protein
LHRLLCFYGLCPSFVPDLNHSKAANAIEEENSIVLSARTWCVVSNDMRDKWKEIVTKDSAGVCAIVKSTYLPALKAADFTCESNARALDS